jgi:D-lactate dehydrogenase
MSADLVASLRAILGPRGLLTDARAMRPYCQGYRFGAGPALAVARPATLLALWRALEACVAADVIVIPQAANTGLTGGSTPWGAYDRPAVIISMGRMGGVHLLRGGEQVLCLPGTTLTDLERALAPIGREPHSVIGSSCLGASVLGGLCNNSGGALVQRGPAYTEYALYARRDEAGALTLVNDLGIALGDDPETMLTRLDRGDFDVDAIVDHGRAASDRAYRDHVRDIDAATPARFNADPRRLHGAAGSAGRVIVFAARFDSFPAPRATKTFYIGSNDPAELATLRRRALRELTTLPIAAEYIHRAAFAIAARYGKDLYLAVRLLGEARIPALLRWQGRLDALLGRAGTSDRLAQRLAGLLPRHLPRRMRAWHERYEHHLLLKAGDETIGEARALLATIFPSASGAVFECDEGEARAAFTHRFAVAGAAVRYRALHEAEVEGIVAVDVALPRNAADWFTPLPASARGDVLHALHYGHFLCHVFHRDYLVKRGSDLHAVEAAILADLDRQGAEYPAEHNVGHCYRAKPALADFYRALDPANGFNPGIGQTSRRANWAREG